MPPKSASPDRSNCASNKSSIPSISERIIMRGFPQRAVESLLATNTESNNNDNETPKTKGRSRQQSFSSSGAETRRSALVKENNAESWWRVMGRTGYPIIGDHVGNFAPNLCRPALVKTCSYGVGDRGQSLLLLLLLLLSIVDPGRGRLSLLLLTAEPGAVL